MQSLTFHIQLNESGFTESQSILGTAAVEAGRMPSNRTEIDLIIRTEDPIETFLTPKNSGRWIRISSAPKCGRIFFILQVAQGWCLNRYTWRIWKGKFTTMSVEARRNWYISSMLLQLWATPEFQQRGAKSQTNERTGGRKERTRKIAKTEIVCVLLPNSRGVWRAIYGESYNVVYVVVRLGEW